MSRLPWRDLCLQQRNHWGTLDLEGKSCRSLTQLFLLRPDTLVLLPEVTTSRSASINFDGMAWWQSSISAHFTSILASVKSPWGFCSRLSARKVLLQKCHWAGTAALCPGTWDLHCLLNSGNKPGTRCPEKLWMPPPWQCSRPGWMGLWETWSSGRCLCPW